jgi:hypothetical protein
MGVYLYAFLMLTLDGDECSPLPLLGKEPPISIKKGLCGTQKPSERHGKQKYLSTGIEFLAVQSVT